MGTSRSWIFYCIVFGVFVNQTSAAEVNGSTGPASKAPPPFVKILDYNDIDGSSSIEFYIQGKTFHTEEGEIEAEYMDILVHPQFPSEFKVLVTLYRMGCDTRPNNQAFLWIRENGTGAYEKWCKDKPDSDERIVISEGDTEIRIGVSNDWGWSDFAVLRATVYHEPKYVGGGKYCSGSFEFYCHGCRQKETLLDFDTGHTGYCMNARQTCEECLPPDYAWKCPCEVGHIPEECCQDLDPGYPRSTTPTYLITLYIAVGAIVAGVILYCLPFYCCRRRVKPPAAQRRPVLRSTTPASHQNQHVEYLPPPYEPPDPGYFEKEAYALDEPPPPSYDSVVKE